VFPDIDVSILVIALGAFLLVGFAGAGVVFLVKGRPQGPEVAPAVWEMRAQWRMRPLALLGRPVWSRPRLMAMYALRGYLVVAVALLLVKAVQLALHK
jgi:hypothetical protein